MEFWGVEVKSGEQLKVQPPSENLIHISQVSLGVVKDVNEAKHVPLRLKVDKKDFIIGTLSAQHTPQLLLDFVFEKEFELSHDWKNGSVYFIGYIAKNSDADVDYFSDESGDTFEEKPLNNLKNGNIKSKVGVTKASKDDAPAKDALKEAQPFAVEDEDSESDSDDEMALDNASMGISSDVASDDSEDDTDGSFSSEELPKIPQQIKKRPAESSEGKPAPSKKPNSASVDNTGKMNGRKSTPLPHQKDGKGPIGNKSKGSLRFTGNKSGGNKFPK